MARLFYPILLTLTALLLAVQWRRHDLPTQWLNIVGARRAQAQSPDSDSVQPPQPRPSRRSRVPPAVGPTAGPPSAQPRPGQPPASQLPRTSFVRPAGGQPAAQGFSGGGPGQVDPRSAIAFDNTKVLARVAGELILRGDVIGTVNMQIAEKLGPDATKVPKRDFEALREGLVRTCVLQLVDLKILLLEARDTIPEDKFPDVQKKIAKQFDEHFVPDMLIPTLKVKTSKEMEAKLQEFGTTTKRMKEQYVERAIATTWLRDHVKADDIDISHKELLEYYRAHLDDYHYPARVRWEELRVKFANHPTKEAARAKMLQMAHQIARGKRWADVARSQSEDADAAHGGAHNWTAQGTYKLKELEDALWTLPVKQMSRPIEDEKGISVVRVVERKPAGVESFLDVQEPITEKLKEARLEKMHEEYMQGLKKRFKVWTIYDDEPAKKTAQHVSPTRR